MRFYKKKKKKFINFLFLHIMDKFNTILISCCTLREKIIYQLTFKKRYLF